MREGVIEVELQIVREPLAHGGEHRIVGGIALVGAQRIHEELRWYHYVLRHQSENGQRYGAEVSLLQRDLIERIDCLGAGAKRRAENLRVDLRARRPSAGLQFILKERQGRYIVWIRILP